jgi:hypothetical protein
MKRLRLKGRGSPVSSSYKGDFVASLLKAVTYSDHPLIKAKVVGDGKEDMLHNLEIVWLKLGF